MTKTLLTHEQHPFLWPKLCSTNHLIIITIDPWSSLNMQISDTHLHASTAQTQRHYIAQHPKNLLKVPTQWLSWMRLEPPGHNIIINIIPSPKMDKSDVNGPGIKHRTLVK